MGLDVNNDLAKTNYHLAIDTSGKVLSYSLAQSSESQKIELIDHVSIREANSHDALLAEGIRDILKKNNLNTTDVHSILLSNGPGAFTGLRIGLSFAKAYAYAINIPLYLFDSLQAKKYTIESDQKDKKNAVIFRHSHAGNYYIHHDDETKYIESQLIEEELQNIENKSNKPVFYSDSATHLPNSQANLAINTIEFTSLDTIKAYNNNCPYEIHPSGKTAIPYYKQRFKPSKPKQKQ